MTAHTNAREDNDDLTHPVGRHPGGRARGTRPGGLSRTGDRFVCGFPPGGTCDLLSRLLAERLTPIFGQRVIVENRAGASGMIAADYVAQAPLDGHTVVLAIMAMHAVQPVLPGVRMPFDVDREPTPIAKVANVDDILVASPRAPFRTIAADRARWAEVIRKAGSRAD